jgi:hypothetical protein
MKYGHLNTIKELLFSLDRSADHKELRLIGLKAKQEYVALYGNKDNLPFIVRNGHKGRGYDLAKDGKWLRQLVIDSTAD